MAFKHVDLPDGQFVDLRTGLTHGQQKVILAAVADAAVIPSRQPLIVDAYILAFVAGWNVKDGDGNGVAWPEGELERRKVLDVIPERTIDAIFDECAAVYADWKKDADPNDSSGTSSGSPTA